MDGAFHSGWGRGAILSALLLTVASSGFGLDRARTIRQFFHTAWTVSDGGPSGLAAMAQTGDGFLWLGTQTGLIRFDGVRFEPYTPLYAPYGAFPSNDVSALLAMPGGGLWIGFAPSGASFLKDGRVVTYREKEGLPTAPIYALANHEGTIWAGTSRGLWRFDGARWQAANADWGFPDARADSFFEDRQGRLWVSTPNQLFCLPRHAAKFELRENARSVRLSQTQAGNLWATAARDLLQTFSGHADPAPSPAATVVRQMLLDRDGGMWIATYGDGIARVPNPDGLAAVRLNSARGVDHFTEKDGLTDNRVMAALEDREGNLWIATRGGLDRFRVRNVIPAPFPYGTGEQDLALVAGRGGAIFAGNLNQPLMRFSNRTVSLLGGPRSTTTAYRDPDGAIWLGGMGTLRRVNGDRIENVAMPALHPGSNWPVQSITRDRRGDLWISVTQNGVFRLRDGTWTRFGSVAGLPRRTAVALWTDSRGRVWLGYTGNLIARMEGDSVRTFSAPEGLDLGTVMSFGGSGERVWAGGQYGLAIFDGARFRKIAGPFSGVSGIVETAGGDLWLNQASGVAHIDPAEVAALLRDAGHPPAFDLFDFRDGVAGIATPLRPLPSEILAPDGRIWVSGTNGAAWIDPGRIYRNPLPPPVVIEALTVDGRRYDPRSTAAVPALPSNLRIDYTALSLSIPERVHFRYRLKGFDQGWQDAGTRRTAFYTRLGPGQFRFDVIACNNDGVWNPTGASVEFTVLPAFYQTAWFIALGIFASGGMLWGLYRLRVRQIARGLQGRLEERLEERERIARELHDTLLQGFQGLILRFEAAAKQISRTEPSRDLMEQALDRADRVMEEGRDRVRNLRSHLESESTLAAALTTAGRELCGDYPGAAFRVVVQGTPADLDSVARDEIYRIGREAVVNAFHHAAAREIEVEIVYRRRELQLRFRDDGCGIDPEVLAPGGGRPGHWGLIGMHERARKLGARLKVSSRPGAGTEVDLRVPAAVAYTTRPHRALWRWPRRIEPGRAAR